MVRRPGFCPQHPQNDQSGDLRHPAIRPVTSLVLVPPTGNRESTQKEINFKQETEGIKFKQERMLWPE